MPPPETRTTRRRCAPAVPGPVTFGDHSGVSGPTIERESRPPVLASRQHGGWFAVLAVATLLAVRLPLPWLAAAVVLTVAADVEGIRTARALVRERRSRGLLVWCVCGIVAISLVGLAAVGTLALYPITYQRQQCLAGANTDVAKAACESEFDRRLGRLHGGFGGLTAASSCRRGGVAAPAPPGRECAATGSAPSASSRARNGVTTSALAPTSASRPGPIAPAAERNHEPEQDGRQHGGEQGVEQPADQAQVGRVGPADASASRPTRRPGPAPRRQHRPAQPAAGTRAGQRAEDRDDGQHAQLHTRRRDDGARTDGEARSGQPGDPPGREVRQVAGLTDDQHQHRRRSPDRAPGAGLRPGPGWSGVRSRRPGS